MNLTLKSSVVLVVLCFVAAPAWSAAGRVQFATGEVIVAGVDGTSKPLSKGAEFNSGDTIQTLSGRAQLRFTDGGFVSLQPNTQFKVDEYAYEGNTAAEGKNFFSLLKGGMRAITGLVGKSNKEAYRVNTPVATIGIRGTEYLAEYDEKLLVKVGDGAVYITNLGGDIILYPGQVGEVSGENVKPQYSTEEPSVNAAAPSGAAPEEVQEQAESENENLAVFSTGELTTDDGNPCVVEGGCAAAVDLGLQETLSAAGNFTGDVYNTLYTGVGADHFKEISTIEVDAQGNLLSLTNTDGTFNYAGETLDKGFVGGGGFGAFGGGLSWARLSGQFTSVDGGVSTLPFENNHVIFGAITPINDPSLANTTATYNFAGGTTPTDGLGNLGTVNSASLDVDFNTAIFVFNMNLTMNSGPGAGNYIVVDRGEVVGNRFNSIDSSQDYSVTGPICSVGNCIPTVDGFFSGSGAIRAGLTYIIDIDVDDQNLDFLLDITGAAAFVKSGLGPNLTPVVSTLPNTYTGLIFFASYDNPLPPSVELGADFATINSDANFQLLNGTDLQDNTTFVYTGSTVDLGALSGGAFNGAGGLSWARLTGGQFIDTDANGIVTTTNISNEHVIFGEPTLANDPVFASGTATYTLSGGTSPTDAAGNLGTLNTGNISVNFTSATFTMNLGLTMNTGPGAGNYIINASGVVSAPNFGATSSSVICPQGTCAATAEIIGFFNGTGAANAGVVYGISGTPATGDIGGAAGFVKTGGGT